MNVTALALMGLVTTLGQPALPDAQDFQVTKVRTHKLGVNYKPERKKDIQEARLFVSRDQGQHGRAIELLVDARDERRQSPNDTHRQTRYHDAARARFASGPARGYAGG